MTPQMYIISALWVLLTGIGLTNQYWLNQTVVAQGRDIAVLNFKVFEKLKVSEVKIEPPSPKAKTVWAAPTLWPMKEENGNP